MNRAESVVRGIVVLADVEIGGNRAWDIQVNNTQFYERMLRDGSIAFGESYMDGWWDSERLDDLIFRLLRADLKHSISPLKLVFPVIMAKLVNRQRRSRAFNIGEHHYDIGNDLFQKMLDPRMVYTCAYWKDASTLGEAQEAKLDLICRKIGLQPGMTILDVGCGWGSFAKYAAEKYGARVTGVTVSKEQVELGRSLCDGLTVEFRLQDYRDMQGTFDRVVSIGMFEQVGAKNCRTFMRTVDRCLAKDGIFLLHTIGVNSRKEAVDPWIDKYIFPDGMLLTAAQIARGAEEIFVMEDWHSMGAHYDPTLMAWMANVDCYWDSLDHDKYDERFYRMWRFFLMSAAGAFRARFNELWQIVFTKSGIDGGYESIR
ncbi:MAG TPA: cyclopropane fatty acyl phospholipid synthase [Acidiferrobacteraceae bacterium]|nr:cyclopropane fatty acyl phospholipid synthase [Acidiferrobacteraceae bacterium]